MNDDQAAQQPAPPGPQVHAATLTTATTGLVVWALGELFHGQVPGEVTGFVMVAVPGLLGRLAAELAYRSRRRAVQK